MGHVVILPVVARPRAYEPAPDMRLADRTNVADFPIIFCGLDERQSRRLLRSLLDEVSE